ncbi:MAG TPA: hypothetical protein VLF43_02600 [Candidatus Saccharimonadales bacterium]|nr:hypothetical protein [Candidatus Saccharimonadales bacterium]
MTYQFGAEATPIPIDEVESTLAYQRARAGYFGGIALKNFGAMRTQVDNDQFGTVIAHVDGDPNNVMNIKAKPAVQHCLVQGARAEVIGNMLGLQPDEIAELQEAAVLHDSFKAHEVKIMKEKGPSWDSYDEAQAEARKSWERTGRHSTRVMDIAGSVAHESIHDMEAILAKPDEDLTAFDKARLAMHYLDDYTVEYYWAEPTDAEGNDLDRRMTKNENNERYKALNETGRQHFNGETAYQAQRRSGHQVEDRLATLITANTGVELNPLDLPVIIDNQIKQEILAEMPAAA